MAKHYDPTDSSSSPFDPTMGATIIYREPRHGRDEVAQCFPGIVLKAYDDDKCDLVVFTSFGTRYIRGVPFSSDAEQMNTWDWPKQPTKRAVKELAKAKASG